MFAVIWPPVVDKSGVIPLSSVAATGRFSVIIIVPSQTISSALAAIPPSGVISPPHITPIPFVIGPSSPTETDPSPPVIMSQSSVCALGDIVIAAAIITNDRFEPCSVIVAISEHERRMTIKSAISPVPNMPTKRAVPGIPTARSVTVYPVGSSIPIVMTIAENDSDIEPDPGLRVRIARRHRRHIGHGSGYKERAQRDFHLI